MFNRQAALPALFQAMEMVNRQGLGNGDARHGIAPSTCRMEFPLGSSGARTTCLAGLSSRCGLSQQVVLRPCQVGHFRDHLGPHPVHTRQFKRRRSNGRANYSQGVRAMQSAAGYIQPGRLAQWQSTPSTWVRSQVRSLERPPSSTKGGMIVTG